LALLLLKKVVSVSLCCYSASAYRKSNRADRASSCGSGSRCGWSDPLPAKSSLYPRLPSAHCGACPANTECVQPSDLPRWRCWRCFFLQNDLSQDPLAYLLRRHAKVTPPTPPTCHCSWPGDLDGQLLGSAEAENGRYAGIRTGDHAYHANLGMVQTRVTLPVEPSVPCQDEWHSGPVGLLPRNHVIWTMPQFV